MITFVAMKRRIQITSLILVLSFLIGTFGQSYLLISFYLNRAEITEKHCENKDKPELACEGQCHLKKQLENTRPTNDVKQDLPSSPRSFLLMFSFFQAGNYPTIQANSIEPKSSIFYTSFHCTDGIKRKILHPPIIA